MDQTLRKLAAVLTSGPIAIGMTDGWNTSGIKTPFMQNAARISKECDPSRSDENDMTPGQVMTSIVNGLLQQMAVEIKEQVKIEILTQMSLEQTAPTPSAASTEIEEDSFHPIEMNDDDKDLLYFTNALQLRKLGEKK